VGVIYINVHEEIKTIRCEALNLQEKYFCNKIAAEKECIMPANVKPAARTASASAVLSKAVARAAERLGISRSLLAKVLGLSPSTITRLYAGDYLLLQSRKEWEFALLFVRAFRSLDSIVGQEATARQWLASDNRGLNGRPIDLISNTEGLVRVVNYLDASRGLI
jgi:uncharacterized protein (DUF2384 family)